MRNFRALSFLAVVAVVQGLSLDDACGQDIFAQSAPSTYYIYDPTKYYALCLVHFEASTTDKTKLTISGLKLFSSQCSVEVFGRNDEFSISGGEITSDGHFTRVITSDSSGSMYLHVQGDQCDLFGLSFKLTEVCRGFTCDDGQCVPSSDVCNGFDDCPDGSDEDDCFDGQTGVYVGVSMAAVAYLIIIGVAVAFFYRRRSRSGVAVPHTR